MTLEQYLIDVGIRASDYGHDIDDEERVYLVNNVDYFKKCYAKGLSAYKALLFFNEHLKGNYDIDED